MCNTVTKQLLCIALICAKDTKYQFDMIWS